MAIYTQNSVKPIQPQQLELLAMNQTGEEVLLPINVNVEEVEADAETEGISLATAMGIGAGVLVLGGAAIVSGNKSDGNGSIATNISSNTPNQVASIQVQGVAQ